MFASIFAFGLLAIFLAMGCGLLPQKLEGSKYQVLRFRSTYLVFQTNGLKHYIENVFYYGPGPGQCGTSTPWAAQSKKLLTTFSTGVADLAGTYYGFQVTVVVPLNQQLSINALPNGIFTKWIDVTTDFDEQTGTLAPSTIPPVAATTGTGGAGATGGAITGDRLPLDNHVTFRKFTGVAGREWSKGRWKFAPIAESDTLGDELTSAAQTRWGVTTNSVTGLTMKQALYQPITDGTSTGSTINKIYPILVSNKLSQLRVMPTRIAYAPLVLPGINYATQVTNAIINATLGEQRNRKEKPDVVF